MEHTLVSLIIPAYNEEQSICKIIDDTVKTMEDLAISYELIVVNDGSTDNTQLAAASYKAKVTVYSNKFNHGKGYCIRKAAKYARGNIIVTLDSDGEHNPAEIPKLLIPVINGTDIVAGSRFLGDKRYVTKKLNLIGNHLFNLTIMILTGRRITDSQTGYRALKRTVFDELNLESDGYEIETEITVKSLLNGFSFKEVPITVEKRKHNISKIKLVPDSTKIMKTILRSSLATIVHNP
jgi:glycosyltransferase involved in cell wall biosynthesis